MGAVVERTAVADRPIVVRTEMVLPVAIPTRTDIHRHRTDNQRDSHTHHHHKALAGMGGMEGRRRCRAMVSTVEFLEADMGPLLSRTGEEGMVVVVVAAAAATVVQGLLQVVTEFTVPRMDTVVVATVGVVAHTMELPEVGGVVVGNSVIYILYIPSDAHGQYLLRVCA